MLDLRVLEGCLLRPVFRAQNARDGTEEEGFLWSGGAFVRNRSNGSSLSDAALRDLAKNNSPVTYTCVPPGSGTRIGIDNDGDGYLDGDEIDASTNPRDPASHP